MVKNSIDLFADEALCETVFQHASLSFGIIRGMVRLIVNADDFGIDKNRTSAILESFRVGAITQTTALANMEYFPEAAKRIADEGRLDWMGIHLNLTEGRPLTESMRRSMFFCDSNGEFNSLFHRDYKKRFYIPHSLDGIIRDELRAQIEQFLRNGGVYMHADSHHHIHTDFSIARVAFPLLNEYGFKSLRKSRNIGAGLSFGKRMYKSVFNRWAAANFECSEYFCSFCDLKAALTSIPGHSTVEVMVHPMFGRPGALDDNAALTDSGNPMASEVKFYRDNRDRLVFHDRD